MAPSAFSRQIANANPLFDKDSDADVYEYHSQASSSTHNSRNLDERDIAGRSELHRAARNGEVDKIADLLSNGAKVDLQDHDGNEPLHLATTTRNPDSIRILLESGAKVDAKGARGKTPLHMALGSSKMTRIILRAHPNLSIPDINGDTALHIALSLYPKRRSTGNRIVEKLLSLGADVNKPNLAGKTPFHIAIQLSSSVYRDLYLDLFFQHEPDVLLPERHGNLPFQTFLDTVWDLYSYPLGFWLDLIMAFLQADPNTVVNQKERLLYMMIYREAWFGYSHEYYNVLVRLCETTDTDAPSSKGGLPLHEAVSNLYLSGTSTLKILRTLFRRHADANRLNEKGECALRILLARKLKVEYIKPILNILLENNADPMLIDSSGKLPIYVACRNFENNDQKDLIKILVKAYVERQESDDQEIQSPHKLAWWLRYKRFCLGTDWSNEAAELLEAAWNMPEDVAKSLPRLVLAFAAEDFLEAAKEYFLLLRDSFGLNYVRTQTKCHYIVRILRDCRTLGLEVDESWYHFLLELF